MYGDRIRKEDGQEKEGPCQVEVAEDIGPARRGPPKENPPSRSVFGMVSRGRHETHHEHRGRRPGTHRRARDGQRRVRPARCARRPPLRPDFLLPGPAVRGAHVDHPGKVVHVPAVANSTRILAYGYLSSQGLPANSGAEQMRPVAGLARLRGMGILAFTFAALVLFAMPASAAAVPGTYTVTALVSNNGVAGKTVDARLENAWGLVAGPTTPWWVSDNGADLSTLYTAAGGNIPREVGVAGAPTGLVFNGDATSFLSGGARARFIFSTEGGTIAGWNGAGDAQAMVDQSGAGAVYKGLAIATTGTGPQLYATDFANARVDVVNKTWDLQASSGFVDPSLPSGYAPFGIQTIGTRIFVTYAKQTPGSHDETAGPSLGIVDAYDTAGNLLVRVAQRGQLNAPWGVPMAPA